MANYSPIRIARFWSKVKVQHSDCACWEWVGAIGANGYGTFRSDGRAHVPAHRAAWEIANGEPLGHRFACHTCDNKICVNPNHIYAGDRQSNARDASERGLLKPRNQAGALNPNAKLMPDQVEEIRQMIALGIPNTHIAPKFGVTHSLISRIKTGRSWGDHGEIRLSQTCKSTVKRCVTL